MRNKRLKKLNKLLLENREFLHHTDKDDFYMIYKKYHEGLEMELINIDSVKYGYRCCFDNNYQLNKWLDFKIAQIENYIRIEKNYDYNI